MLQKNKNAMYIIGLTVLLISNICFYTLETMVIFLVLSGVGMLLVFGQTVMEFKFDFLNDDCFIWLTLIYAMFTVYGVFFLRSGTYNWDFMLFTYVVNLAIYICFKRLMNEKKWDDIKKCILMTSLFVVIYILVVEFDDLIKGGIRIGSSLSGDVNTVAACLGILTLFTILLCCICQEKILYGLFLVLACLMLLTGSKMSVIYLAMVCMFIFLQSKRKGVTLFVLGIAALVVLIAIFTIPQLYEVIGSRIQDMVFQLTGLGNGKYSHSTDVRKQMIQEGFVIFLEHPILGGGEKYFGLNTATEYADAHCNYAEMLCNFGIFGTVLFYFPVFRNLYICIKERRNHSLVAYFCIVLLATRLVMDWAQMTYPGISIHYLPMLVSFAWVSSFIPSKKRRHTKLIENIFNTIKNKIYK